MRRPPWRRRRLLSTAAGPYGILAEFGIWSLMRNVRGGQFERTSLGACTWRLSTMVSRPFTAQVAPVSDSEAFKAFRVDAAEWLTAFSMNQCNNQPALALGGRSYLVTPSRGFWSCPIRIIRWRRLDNLERRARSDSPFGMSVKRFDDDAMHASRPDRQRHLL